MQHLATRTDEYRKEDAPLGSHCSIKEVAGTAEIRSATIDQTGNIHKLLTKEVLLVWSVINDYIICYVITAV